MKWLQLFIVSFSETSYTLFIRSRTACLRVNQPCRSTKRSLSGDVAARVTSHDPGVPGAAFMAQ